VRILLIQQSYKTGGAVTFVDRLIRYFNYQKIDNYVVCQNDHGKFINAPHTKFINSKFLSLSFKFKSVFLAFIVSIIEFFEALRLNIKIKPDLIFISCITNGTLLGTLLVKKPTVFFIHSYPESSLGGLSFILKFRFVKKHVRFVTVSNYSASLIAKYYFMNIEDIEVLPNYGKFKVKEINNSNSFNILTIGHVSNYKNPYFWIEVAKKVIAININFKFYWLGEGTDLIEVKKIIKNSGLENNILFLGHCSNIEFYYEKAFLYLQPSLVESQGIAVVEALQYGIPCIVSKIGGLPETVKEGISGYIIEEFDSGIYCDRILKLASDINLYNKISAGAFDEGNNKFSEEIWNSKIDILLRNAANQ
jgi:glycosyltransferase involved in cell wall biosynthesis